MVSCLMGDSTALASAIVRCCLITLDRRIDAQQSLVKSLKKYKRGALKAVFTQQVSFSAKPQKWDKYKMGDLISDRKSVV